MTLLLTRSDLAPLVTVSTSDQASFAVIRAVTYKMNYASILGGYERAACKVEGMLDLSQIVQPQGRLSAPK